MRRYSIVHPVWLSFFSKDLYRDVGRHWGGLSFLYLFLLLAVAWVPAMIQFDAGVREFVRQEAPKFVEQIPRITIQDGRASADVEQPHCIVDPDNDECVAIIDTTGATTGLAGTEARVLLTETELIFARSKTETRVHSLEQFGELTIDQDLVNGWLAIAARILAVVAFPFVVLFSFCFRAIQALLYAVVGLLFTRMRRMPLSFMALCSLAAVALTPVIVAQTALDAARAGGSVPRLLFLAVGLGYLLFGIKACVEPAAESPLHIGHTGPPPLV